MPIGSPITHLGLFQWKAVRVPAEQALHHGPLFDGLVQDQILGEIDEPATMQTKLQLNLMGSERTYGKDLPPRPLAACVFVPWVQSCSIPQINQLPCKPGPDCS